jgi:hypothetical protein
MQVNVFTLFAALAVVGSNIYSVFFAEAEDRKSRGEMILALTEAMQHKLSFEVIVSLIYGAVHCCFAVDRTILRFYGMLFALVAIATELELEMWLSACRVLEGFVSRGVFYTL